MPVIQALGRWRQGGQEFKAFIDYNEFKASLIYRKPLVSQKKKKNYNRASSALIVQALNSSTQETEVEGSLRTPG